MFGGEAFQIIWTNHAKERAKERGIPQFPFISSLLRVSLLRAETEISNQLQAIAGPIDVYDTATDVFAALVIDRSEYKLKVICFGRAAEMYPRVGDLVLQMNDIGLARILRWQHVLTKPVYAGFKLHLNGRSVPVYWVNGCAKMRPEEADEANRKAAKALSVLEDIKIQEGKTINLFDWREDAYFGIELQPDKLAIKLYQNATAFQPKDTFARIDIDANGCKFTNC